MGECAGWKALENIRIEKKMFPKTVQYFPAKHTSLQISAQLRNAKKGSTSCKHT